MKFLANIVTLLILSGAVAFFEFRDSNNFNLDSPEGMGAIVGSVLAKVLIPLIIAAVPIGIYKVWKKKIMPRRYTTIWVFWCLLSLTPALLRIAT